MPERTGTLLHRRRQLAALLAAAITSLAISLLLIPAAQGPAPMTTEQSVTIDSIRARAALISGVES